MKALKLGIIGAGSFVIKRHIPEIIKEKKKNQTCLNMSKKCKKFR